MGLTCTVFFEETGVQDKQMAREKLMGAHKRADTTMGSRATKVSMPLFT